jgi:hypothetical protein
MATIEDATERVPPGWIPDATERVLRERGGATSVLPGE